jgi:hypothetical protein
MHRQEDVVFSRSEPQNDSHIAEILFVAMKDGFERRFELPCFAGRFAPIAIVLKKSFCAAFLDKNFHIREGAKPAED